MVNQVWDCFQTWIDDDVERIHRMNHLQKLSITLMSGIRKRRGKKNNRNGNEGEKCCNKIAKREI